MSDLDKKKIQSLFTVSRRVNFRRNPRYFLRLTWRFSFGFFSSALPFRPPNWTVSFWPVWWLPFRAACWFQKAFPAVLSKFIDLKQMSPPRAPKISKCLNSNAGAVIMAWQRKLLLLARVLGLNSMRSLNLRPEKLKFRCDAIVCTALYQDMLWESTI